jgi:eukaryotic-like serine/threonine-protein kinase
VQFTRISFPPAFTAMRLSLRCSAFLLVLSACHTPSPEAQEPVVVFRGGADHSGRFDSTTGAAYDGLAWRFATEGPVRSSPALTPSLVIAGSGDGNLYAVDRKSGRLRWKFAADAAVNSSPAVHGGAVFFTSLKGTMYAVSLADGHSRWSRPSGPGLSPAWAGASGIDYYASSPVVTDQLVIVGSPDGNLYALSQADGSVRWQGRTEGRIHSSPAIRNGAVYVGSFDGRVYCFDLSTGSRRWQFETEGRKFDSQSAGFDRQSIIASPSVTDSTVFVGSRDGFFYAINAVTGAVRWRADHDGSWSIASPAVDGGVVFDASSDGRFVHALSADNGAELWRLATNGSVWSSPAVAGSTIFVGDGSGAINAIDRQTGQLRWVYRTGAGVLSSPVLRDSVLYVGSNDGGIYALRIGGGTGLLRAVYWDSTLARASMRSDHQLLRDGLANRGYVPVSAAEFPGWLEQRIQDHRPSVVILATDQLPVSLAEPGAALRRYLDAGGKLVSVGDPPFIWPVGPSGDRAYATISRSTTSKLLGVEHAVAQFDRYSARPSEQGREWGLNGWWLSSWSIEPPPGAEILASDERGLAAAWVKRYGGPRGTGFVQVNRGQWSQPDLAQLVTIAEYRPE